MTEVKFKVGKYTCRVSLPEVRPGVVSHATVEWDPHIPLIPLTDAEKEQYEAGMRLAVMEVSNINATRIHK